jgi:hypothetical protein
MTDMELACPIVRGHTARPQTRWSEPGLDGYKCATCGEYSLAPDIPAKIAQYGDDRREEMSLILAAIWNGGDGVAARLDDEGLTKVASMRLAAADREHPEKLQPIPSGVESLKAIFERARKQRRS